MFGTHWKQLFVLDNFGKYVENVWKQIGHCLNAIVLWKSFGSTREMCVEHVWKLLEHVGTLWEQMENGLFIKDHRTIL